MFPFLVFLLVASVGCIGISDGPWIQLFQKKIQDLAFFNFVTLYLVFVVEDFKKMVFLLESVGSILRLTHSRYN
jgi:hypothetical protein